MDSPSEVGGHIKDMRVGEALRAFYTRVRSQVGLRIFASVLLFSFAVTLTLTAIQLYLEYRRGVDAIDSQLVQIEYGYLGSLREGLWRLDEGYLQAQVDGIVRLPHIRAVEIREIADRAPLVVTAGQRASHGAVAKEFPIFYSVRGTEQRIGTLYVEATLTELYRELRRTALVILLNEGLKTFLVSAFILYIVHRLVTRHLTTLARFVQGYDLRNPPPPLRLSRGPQEAEDELGQVAAAFNTMCANLQRAYTDLREREARIQRLVDSNIIGVFFWTLAGEVTAANDAMLRMIGYDRQALRSGRIQWAELTPPEHEAADARAMEELRAGGACQPYEKEFLRRDGSRVPVLIGAALFEGSRDEGVAFVLDLTERRRAEAERAARQSAEAANAAKSAFLASMSHDLRTPMFGVLGFTDLLRETNLDPIQREYVRLVDQSASSLLGLLNDVLDFSKIEAGELILEQGTLRLDDVLGESMHSHAAPAADKSLELAYHLPPELADLTVEGDRLRLRQVIDNLVSNAVKFTDEGHVAVDVSAVSRADSEVVLRFEVEDTGIGIPKEQRAEIFEAFQQLKPPAARQGVGLGLAIAARLVERMGGEIGVQSEPGRGSTFWFTARLGVAGEVSRFRASRDLLQGRRVLVVDDYPLNLRILTEIVESWEMEPAAVGSGPMALEELRRAVGAGAPYDLVLLDQVMPEMSGLEVAERIRGDDALRDLPIVLLSSAAAGLVEPGRLRSARISHSLPKPVSQLELWTAVVEVLGAPTEKAPSKDRPGAVSTRRVLLAEDSPVNQALVIRLLEKRGHDVTLARNGREAVEAFEPGRFDILLMDVEMPEMDGLDATRAIRAAERESGTHVPIIAMTAHAMKGDREKCLEAGMDDYLTKPARAEDLYAVVEGTGPEQASNAPTRRS
ncbi:MULTISPECIES: response regulator [unclassified Microbulbifer]|uniref:response regulator n=1 Tax=unclassified Microbulbifer TaxID=2619833 RepID=UPI0027E5AAAB|nr:MULTISPECIES: response regulator [unclassified Microbulbifer]